MTHKRWTSTFLWRRLIISATAEADDHHTFAYLPIIKDNNNTADFINIRPMWLEDDDDFTVLLAIAKSMWMVQNVKVRVVVPTHDHAV